MVLIKNRGYKPNTADLSDVRSICSTLILLKVCKELVWCR